MEAPMGSCSNGLRIIVAAVSTLALAASCGVPASAFEYADGGRDGLPAETAGDDVVSSGSSADDADYEAGASAPGEESVAVPETAAASTPQGVLDASGQAVEGATYYYTGATIDPVAKVDGLAEGAYIVKYLNNKAAPAGDVPSSAASTAVAVVCPTGAGDAGSGTVVTFKIRKRNLDGEFEIDEVKSQAAGSLPKLSIRAKAGGTALVEGRDYRLSYSDAGAAPGTKATVTATALETAESLCAGSVSVEYGVLATEDANELLIDAIGTQAYTGKAIEPDVKVRFKPKGGQSRELAPSDYTVSFKDNVAEGTATVTVEGKGEYAGLRSAAIFQIAKGRGEGAAADSGRAAKAASIASAEVDMPEERFVYTGAEIEPSLTLSFAGEKLVKGRDYAIEYKNNVNAGTATAVIRGMGRFSGSRTETFPIGKADISKANGNAATQAYAGGKALEPKVSLTFNKKALSNSSYEVTSYANNTKPGTGRITVSGKGNFTGKKVIEFTIGKMRISDAKITHPVPYYADGLEEVKPKVTVSVNGKKLSPKTDYTISYKNNKNPGVASFTVTARKNSGFTGSKTVKFRLMNVGDDTAAFACRLSYSRAKGNSNGTSLYRKFGGYADCGQGMAVAYRKSKHFYKTALFNNGYRYKKKGEGMYLGKFNPNKSPEKQGLLPGDILIREGSFHTLMYVGKTIPKKIYKEYLKGTEADIGEVEAGSAYVSAHHFYDGGAGLCICKRKWSLANSNFDVYRLVHDVEWHQPGKKVQEFTKLDTSKILTKKKNGKTTTWNSDDIDKYVKEAKAAK